MFNISESQKKVLSFWAILGVILLILVVFLAIIIKRESDAKEELFNNMTAKDSNKLIDRNRYYTVKGAINKYYSYLNMQDYDSVITILDKNYVNSNNITKNNVKKHLTDTELQLSYETKVMCLKSINKGVYIFVVEGNEISMNKGTFISNKYYQVIMDGNTSIFSLLPIDKSTYEEVCNENS